MTRAPFATAHLIARASASTGIERWGPTTFATRSCAGGARPAIPTPSFVRAAMSPATNVPCPCVSTVAGPETKLFAAAMRPRSSGCSPSTPESITATRTGARGGSSTHASNARFCAAYHCRGRNGSSGSYATRRAPRASMYRVPPTPRRAERPGAETASARIGSRSTTRDAPRARSSAATAAPSAAGASPTAKRAALTGRAAARQSADASEEGRRPRSHFGCPVGTLIVSAGPTWPSAVSL